MSARDHALTAAAALAFVLLIAGAAHRIMSWAIPDGQVGMTILVRR